MKIILMPSALSVDGKIVIDARKTTSEKNPKGWIDPQAYKEMGDIWGDMRRTYANNENVEEALIELVAKKFDVEREAVDAVEIEGGIPEHWKEMREGKIRFR